MNKPQAEEQIASYRDEFLQSIVKSYEEFSSNELFIRIEAMQKILWTRSKMGEK